MGQIKTIFLLLVWITSTPSYSAQCNDLTSISARVSGQTLQSILPGIEPPTSYNYEIFGTDHALDQSIAQIQDLQGNPAFVTARQAGKILIGLEEVVARALEQKNKDIMLTRLDSREPWIFKEVLKVDDRILQSGRLRSPPKEGYHVLLTPSDAAIKSAHIEFNISLAAELSRTFPDKFSASMSVQERVDLFDPKNPKCPLTFADRKRFAPVYLNLAKEKRDPVVLRETLRFFELIGFRPLMSSGRPLFIVVSKLDELVPLAEAIQGDRSVLTNMYVDNYRE